MLPALRGLFYLPNRHGKPYVGFLIPDCRFDVLFDGPQTRVEVTTLMAT